MGHYNHSLSVDANPLFRNILTLQKVTSYHVDYNMITVTKWGSITTANNNINKLVE